MSMLHLSLACGERLSVLRFSVRESLSALFMVKVVASSPDPCIDFEAILGEPASLRVAPEPGEGVHGERLWSGVCSHIRQLHGLDVQLGELGVSTYELTLVPRLWLLTRRTAYRVYQHVSSPELVSSLLDEWGLAAAWRMDEGAHPRFAYRVQYGETDFDFLSRMLEESGIAYAFLDDGDGTSRLVFSDEPHRSAPRRQASIAYVDRPMAPSAHEVVMCVAVEAHLRPASVTLRDHDFLRPGWSLLGHCRDVAARDLRIERYGYHPGAFLVEADGAGASRHDDEYAAVCAARALEAEQCGTCVVSFHTNTLDVLPGSIFSVEGHPRAELDPRVGLLVTSLSIDGAPRGDWTIRGEAIPASAPYRSPRRTPKPRAYGVQSATVVGPPGQEIHTDEHGRVRVQFPWDRLGTMDERSSCWVRVAQGWAGAGHGIFALPRVGQEVLVAFLAGDPDQPVIVGRLSNALNPLPLKLPDDGTQSVWKSSSSPGGGGYNEIRFEDRQGHEILSVRAERRLRTTVGSDEELAVARNRAKTIGGDESARTEGREIAYVGRDAHRTVDRDLRERIGGTRSLTVEGDQHQRVGGAAALDAGGTIHIQAGTAVVIEAADVTLRGPGGFVRIDASGVRIDGGAVKIHQGGAPGGAPPARPALPLLPGGVALRDEPRRLPLLAFTGGLPPMQAGGLGGGGPLTPEEGAVCGFICRCGDEPLPQQCVTRHIRMLEDASAHTSPLKAEVPYDMSKDPPEPIMSKNDPRRATRGRPKGSRIPDVVVVKDGTKPPTQDNIKEVIEIKFPPDKLGSEQRKAYDSIAGRAPLEELGPDRCGCPRSAKNEQQVTAGDVAEVAALTLLVIALVADDALPGGQVDDVAIPPAIARILSKIAPLLRGSVPVVP
ncbi:type VI secretion system tip protein TssI/VgrG [Sorangium sp. So ce1024]|uniref:type VI secretion system tip protein TssI/VgrG n=1 Tax=Sorangium sp. So ce1024 TaxID=3133327 RepID=UPI003F09C318